MVSITATARIFPDLATVQTPSISQDELGAEVMTWSTLYADVLCQFSAFAPASSSRMTGELREPHDVYVSSEYRAILLGDLDISTSDQLVVSGKTYDIRGVERDSFKLVTTLRLEGN